MSATMTDPPAGMTHYLGMCDVCRSVKTFDSARSRDLWEKFHPHEEDGE